MTFLANISQHDRPVSESAMRLERLLSPETVVKLNEPMARRTTLRVGGPADMYVEPGSEQDLVTVVQFCATERLPVFVLGRGSNLLVRDGGIRGVVICLAHPSFRRIDVSGSYLECGAGAKLKDVAVTAKQHSISGLEFLEGIPGSVGGALRMNAGAMGGSVFQCVESVRILDFTGIFSTRTAAEMQPEYRCCPALRDVMAVSAVLHGRPGEHEEIQTRMTEYSRKRWATQPAAPSAGCIFKNPAGIAAGKLVDELGLKGTRVGGAVVSAEHGNFIVNEGKATARDVLDLIELIRTVALRERGIRLETEVEIVGQ